MWGHNRKVRGHIKKFSGGASHPTCKLLPTPLGVVGSVTLWNFVPNRLNTVTSPRVIKYTECMKMCII